MRKLLLILALVFGCAASAWAQAPSVPVKAYPGTAPTAGDPCGWIDVRVYEGRIFRCVASAVVEAVAPLDSEGGVVSSCVAAGSECFWFPTLETAAGACTTVPWMGYITGTGWRACDAEDSTVKDIFTAGGSITVREIDTVPTVSNTTIIQFDETDGFVVTDNTGGVAEVEIGSLPLKNLTDNDATSGQCLLSGGAGGNPAYGTCPGDVATDAIWDAAGDLAVGSGADTAARLAKGTTGQVLQSGASTLAWADSVDVDHTTTSPATGSTMYYNTTDTEYEVLAAGTSGQFLRAKGAAAPAWETITETFCYTMYNAAGLVDTYDVPSVWSAPVAVTVTAVWCEADVATDITIQFQKDDAGNTAALAAAPIENGGLQCGTTRTDGTVVATGAENLGDGDTVDFEIVAETSATRVTACFEYTRD